MINGHLVDIGFKSLMSDPFVYIDSEGGTTVILTVYVDDVLLLLGNDVKVLGRIKQKLMNRFSTTDKGRVASAWDGRYPWLGEKDCHHHPGQLHQVPAGAVRYGELQLCVHTRCV